MAYFSEHDLALICAHRKPASRFGFAVLLCYLKNVGFAPDKKIPPSDALLKYIASRLKVTGDLWPAYLSGMGHERYESTEVYLKVFALDVVPQLGVTFSLDHRDYSHLLTRK